MSARTPTPVTFHAPWTQEQVDGLTRWQTSGVVHEYTCGADSSHRPLVATANGWTCPDCPYRQDWAILQDWAIVSTVLTAEHAAKMKGWADGSARTPAAAVRRFDSVSMADGLTLDVTGVVIRVARHGMWADVRWVDTRSGATWTKRQPDRTKLRVTWRDGSPVAPA